MMNKCDDCIMSNCCEELNCCCEQVQKYGKAIEQRVRADVIDEFKQGFYEHAHFEPWSMKFEIYQSDLIKIAEQLKGERK